MQEYTLKILKASDKQPGLYGAMFVTTVNGEEKKHWAKIVETHPQFADLQKNIGGVFVGDEHGPTDAAGMYTLSKKAPASTSPAVATLPKAPVETRQGKTQQAPAAKQQQRRSGPQKNPRGVSNIPTVAEYMDFPAPTRAGEWTINQIVAALSRVLPEEFLETKTVQGQTLTYISWYGAVQVMSRFCPGWNYEIMESNMIPHPTRKAPDQQALVTRVRVTVPCADGMNGVVYREQAGIATTPAAFGDLSSVALSMAFRRACATLGLGLYLYEGHDVVDVNVGEGVEA